ncbi:uncharacterized protein N0V96_011984 [Colletotrichum fioriniae]|uniref:uncharacterized protein n=1 Tax=Colletotrichum fioriniae TaxID=710243 RepID=UPI0032DAD60C|nr:hypothetical protein N0V96_011984 [Colletotrichum fioriniae]
MAQDRGPYRVPDLDVDVEVDLRMSADKFKELLNDIHVDKIGKTTLEDVYRCLRDIQFQQQEKKTLMNLNRIELFLIGMDSFREVLDDRRMKGVDGIMALVWGPMRFLLEDRHAFRSVDSGFAAPQNSILLDNNDFRRKSKKYMSDYDELRRTFREDEAKRKEKQKNKVLKWIAAPMTTQDLHESFVKKREPYPETGRWLYTRYDQVSNWMREDIPQDSALWVHGRKGLGKSILSSLVVTRLQELIRTQSIPKGQICYFYCQDADPELNTYFGILRGIAHQLVSAVDVSNPDFDESREDECDISAYRSKYNGSILPLCDDKITSSGGSTLSTPEGCLSLIEAFFEVNPRLYIVVDGVDECASRVEIQQTVSFLVAQVSRLDEINQGQLRVLFMSQPNPDVKAAMSKPTSEGLFLYAVLAVEYLLNQWSKGELLQKVSPRMLPDGISRMYDKVLESLKEKMLNMSSTHWDKTKLLLGWLSCAHRPLKWHEIQAILAYDLEKDEIDFNLRMIRRDNINKLLGSLVEVLPGDEIRLMHSTVKQHIHAKSVQCDLAILCLRYLSLRCFAADDYSEAERHNDIHKGYFSFQDYAVPQWYKHINTVIRECHEIFSPTFYPDAGVEPGRDFVRDLGSALNRFISAYDANIKKEMHQEFSQDDLSQYISFPFYADLVRVWNHIFTHQKASVDERNEVGISRLQDALTSHREVLANEQEG